MAGLLVCAVACILLAATSAAASPLVFNVGGRRGWREPTGKEKETYNHWATKKRFHVGDYLYFKYTNDSILVVTHDDYKLCSAAKPVLRFSDGETKFQLDWHGYFYFISGEPGHCEAGQRLIVRVAADPVGGAPAPAPSGGDWSVSSGSSPAAPGSGSPSPGEASAASRHAHYIVGVILAAVLSGWVLV